MVAHVEQPVSVVGELPDQRLAGPVEGLGMIRVGGIGQDAPRTDREDRTGLHRHRDGGRAPGTVHEGQPPIGAEEEPDPDIAPLLPSILAIDRGTSR